MNNHSRNSFILFVFSLNILALIFLDEIHPVLGLLIKLFSISGLVWIVYYFYNSLRTYGNSGNHNEDIHIDKITLGENIDLQFSKLIDKSFNFVKDISSDYQVGIYFYQPDSNLFELRNSTSDSFVDSIPKNNSFVEKLKNDIPQHLFYQRDNQNSWKLFFKEDSPKGGECIILEPLSKNTLVSAILSLSKI